MTIVFQLPIFDSASLAAFGVLLLVFSFIFLFWIYKFIASVLVGG